MYTKKGKNFNRKEATILSMKTSTSLPICFSTFSIEKALQELVPLCIENLSIVEDADTGIHQIFGEIDSEASIPPLCFCKREEVSEDIWTDQWKTFAPHFKDGFAHIDLSEYNGPGINFRMLPGAGFGDLSHPTTEMCLRFLCQNRSKQNTVVDIGTGSGVLALAAHYLGFKAILALEIDEASIHHAKKNFEISGASSIMVHTHLAAVPSESLILLNMTLGEQEFLFESTPALLASSGEWIISGLLADQAQDYIRQYFRGRDYQLELKDDWAALHILPKKF